jgi:hypothetical protein
MADEGLTIAVPNEAMRSVFEAAIRDGFPVQVRCNGCRGWLRYYYNRETGGWDASRRYCRCEEARTDG